ncbi:MAG TPA: flagellar basal body rod protein FlgB [Pseudomonas sp.]|nr:flagellar basal body rod protein FlgB [Pseudomonas sp.]
MAISFDKALGIHEKALSFRAQRAEVLANNIANADTPHYKARDLEFSSVLASQTNKSSFGLNRTSTRHIEGETVTFSEAVLQYRTPHHPSIDGNTVDAQVEQAAYTKNAVDFQASFTFLNNKFKGLMSAIKGE